MTSERTSRWKTTYHLRGLDIGFVGQSAISNIAEAALMTVLSFIWCIAGGKQVVVVQHVDVSSGGRAVVAGSMNAGVKGLTER
jgi:hypothetical protein